MLISKVSTVAVLATFVALTTIGCSTTTSSSVQVSPQAKSPESIVPTASKDNEKKSVESSEKVSLENSETSSESVADQIENGRYWIGHTGQGLEVEGMRYRYDTEGGSQPWQDISNLKYVKNGVVFDGKKHWCLSTLAPKDKVAFCTSNRWQVSQTERSEERQSEGTMAAEFRFYLRQDLEEVVRQGGSDRLMQQDPRIIKMMRTACGMGAMARVTAMPLSQDALVPEKVVEVDAENKTRRRWAKPLDARVLAIDGDRILVEADNNERYWIDTAGNLERSTVSRSFPSPSTVPYKKHPEFGASGVYSQRFVDVSSGRDRQIIADAPCT